MSTEHLPPSGEPRPLPPARHRVRPASPAAAIPVAPPAPAPSDTDPSYEVGYGKPPKRTQFQPGQSGNPRGRPRGAKGLNVIVRETMTQKISVRTAAGERRMSRMEAVMHKTLELAMKGNGRALAQLVSLYSAAVPDQIAPMNVLQDTEDLSATDLAMLEALRQSWLEPGELTPQTNENQPPAAAEDDAMAPSSSREPDSNSQDDTADDYDWDRRLV